MDTAVVKKSFLKAGILYRDFNVVHPNVTGEDPFRDLDPQLEEDQGDPEPRSLMKQTHGDNHCFFNTFVVTVIAFQPVLIWIMNVGFSLIQLDSKE